MLLLAAIAEAHPGAANVAPDFGGDEQKPQPHYPARNRNITSVLILSFPVKFLKSLRLLQIFSFFYSTLSSNCFESVENWGAFRLVVGIVSGQPYQRGQGFRQRHMACDQSRRHSTANSRQCPHARPHLPRGSVSPFAYQAGYSESHHDDGPPARPLGLSNAEVRSTISLVTRKMPQLSLGAFWKLPFK